MDTRAGRRELATELDLPGRVSEFVRQHVNDFAKTLVNRLSDRVSLDRQPAVEDVDYIAAKIVNESQYYSQWRAACPIFTPWLGHPEFQPIYEAAAPYTVVSPDRCYILMSLARYASHLPGDFAECGVYKGGTALLLAQVLSKSSEKRLYLFDSFQGLPKIDENKDHWFHEGQFSDTRIEAIEDLFRGCSATVDIRAGWIPHTFIGLESNRYVFVHVDVDLYQSSRDCCEYFYPRLTTGGILLFDDYGFAAARGEKDAVDEFFADKPERPFALPTGQALVLKVPQAT